MRAEPRRATAADAPKIAELVEDAYAAYAERLGFRPAPMNADQAAEISAKEVWVIPSPGQDGALEAVAVLRPEPGHVFVDNVAVRPRSQGRGLGRTLLELAEERARELGCEEVRLLTNERMVENRAIYRHLGWQETEVRAERGYSRVYLRKRLSRG